MERLAALIYPALRIVAQAHYRGIRQVSLQAVLFGSLLTRKLASLGQCSKQNFMPPCSIKEIAQTAPKHFQHIHSLCSKFWRSAVKVVSTPISALCIANEYASNANPLVWYFLNGAFGMFVNKNLVNYCSSLSKKLNTHYAVKWSYILFWTYTRKSIIKCPIICSF